MSVQTQIDRIKTNVENSFVAVAAKGGTVPESQNSDNLPDAIMGIPASSGGSNYQISITFDAAFLGQPYIVKGPEEETHTGVVPDSLKETVQVYHGGSEYIVSSTDASGKKSIAIALIGSLFGSYTVELKVVHIYGATWSGTSTTKWARIDEATDFTDPIPYVAEATDYGSPFDDIMPWSGMTIEERTAGTMVKIPKFWYQLYQNTEGVPGSGMTIRIADGPVEGFSVSPAHMNRGDGRGERDVVYVGRYHCGSDFKSKTGVSPRASMTRANSRTNIHALGANIWQLDFATRFTIWLLYLVEFADWNSQACIGYGCGNGSGGSKKSMGYTNPMPYHTGTTQSKRTTYGFGTQYRNIEGLWDNVYDWIDGCYNNSKGMNIVLNPNNFDDEFGGVSVGVPTSYSPNIPSKFTITVKAGFRMFIPNDTNGSGTTYSCDTWTFATSTECLRAGGTFNSNSNSSGLFRISNADESTTDTTVGCRLMELPD